LLEPSPVTLVARLGSSKPNQRQIPFRGPYGGCQISGSENYGGLYFGAGWLRGLGCTQEQTAYPSWVVLWLAGLPFAVFFDELFSIIAIFGKTKTRRVHI